MGANEQDLSHDSAKFKHALRVARSSSDAGPLVVAVEALPVVENVATCYIGPSENQHNIFISFLDAAQTPVETVISIMDAADWQVKDITFSERRICFTKEAL